jgi:hypothetical protein
MSSSGATPRTSSALARAIFASALAALLAVQVARAGSDNWNDSPPAPGNPSCPNGGKWSNGDCWLYAGLGPTLRIKPKSGDTAAISFRNARGTVTLDTAISLDSFAVDNAIFNQNGYSIQAARESLGSAARPTIFNQTGGTHSVTGEVGITGTYNLSKGTLSAAGIVLAADAAGGLGGIGGTTFFNQSSGTTVTLSNLFGIPGGLQVGAQGAASYTMKGGTLSAGVESIGVLNGSSGSFLQTGGSNTVSNGLGFGGSLFVGATSGSNGAYTLTGSASTLRAGTELIGVSGSGTLRMDDGSNASALQIVGPFGTVIQSAGTNTTTGLLVGNGAGSPATTGVYNLSGGILKADSETLGTQVGMAPGIFNQYGGTNTVTNNLVINLSTISALRSLSRYSMSGGTLLAGDIINYGTFALSGGSAGRVETGTLHNAGTFLWTSGTLTADVTNQSGAVFMTEGHGIVAPLLLVGDLTNLAGGQVEFSGLTKTGAFHDAGPVLFDPTTAEVSQITVAPTGYLVAGAGSALRVDGDFVNQSAQKALWNTSAAALDFTGTGTHHIVLNGIAGAGAANNFAWGTLSLGTGTLLDLVAGAGDALYVGALKGIDISGRTVTNIEGTSGLVLYYDTADNPALSGDYQLAGGGELVGFSGNGLGGGGSGGGGGGTAVPEPGVLGLMTAGLALVTLVGSGRRHRRRPRC